MHVETVVPASVRQTIVRTLNSHGVWRTVIILQHLPWGMNSAHRQIARYATCSGKNIRKTHVGCLWHSRPQQHQTQCIERPTEVRSHTKKTNDYCDARREISLGSSVAIRMNRTGRNDQEHAGRNETKGKWTNIMSPLKQFDLAIRQKAHQIIGFWDGFCWRTDAPATLQANKSNSKF